MTTNEAPTELNQDPRLVELAAYEAGEKVNEHSIAIQNSIVSVANLYLVTTGALWVAVSSNRLDLPTYAAVVVMVFHLVGSAATFQFIAANINAMKLRFYFVREFGRLYYPHIEKDVGRNSFVKVYGGTKSFRARFFRWGNPPRILWYLIPLAGFAGSFYFILRVLGIVS